MDASLILCSYQYLSTLILTLGKLNDFHMPSCCFEIYLYIPKLFQIFIYITVMA